MPSAIAGFLPGGEGASGSASAGGNCQPAAEMAVQEAPVSLECGCYDVGEVREMAQMLLVALGTACVEKTYGGLFNPPASFVEDARKEMVENLCRRSEGLAGEGGSSEDGDALPATPASVIENMLDDFVQSKTSLLSRLSSGIINSEKKEDAIEDFVQELEGTGAWVAGCREDLAKNLFKRLDRSNAVVCGMRFESGADLVEHKSKCTLRPVTCANEGCGEAFSAIHDKLHDSACPLKLIPCEQNCKALVRRREMDKHCITDCSMKLVNCPFYNMGCATSLPQDVVQKHCREFAGAHLLCLQHSLQKLEVLVASATQRVLILKKALSITQRSEAINVETLLLTIREQDTKIKALDQDAAKLQKDLKANDVTEEVLQLHREVRNLQKQIETQYMRSSISTSL